MHCLPTPSLTGSQASPSPGVRTLAGSDGLHCSEPGSTAGKRGGGMGKGGDTLPASGQEGRSGAEEREVENGEGEGMSFCRLHCSELTGEPRSEGGTRQRGQGCHWAGGQTGREMEKH